MAYHAAWKHRSFLPYFEVHRFQYLSGEVCVCLVWHHKVEVTSRNKQIGSVQQTFAQCLLSLEYEPETKKQNKKWLPRIHKPVIFSTVTTISKHVFSLLFIHSFNNHINTSLGQAQPGSVQCRQPSETGAREGDTCIKSLNVLMALILVTRTLGKDLILKKKKKPFYWGIMDI